MKSKKLKNRLRQLADTRCRTKHRDYYDSLICVGPGSARGFGPPCDACITEIEREHKEKESSLKKQKT